VSALLGAVDLQLAEGKLPQPSFDALQTIKIRDQTGLSCGMAICDNHTSNKVGRTALRKLWPFGMITSHQTKSAAQL